MKPLHPILRTVHLVLGLFAAPFLMMYAFSAMQMTAPPLFKLKPTVAQSSLVVSPEAASSPRALARVLMAQQGMTGELASITTQSDSVAFQIVRPGTVYQVRYRAGSDSVHVTTSVAGMIGFLNRLHHAAGVNHPLGMMSIWGIFVGLISVALLGLGATGVYMWYRTQGERVIGGLLLAAGLVVGVGLIIATRLQQ